MLTLKEDGRIDVFEVFKSKFSLWIQWFFPKSFVDEIHKLTLSKFEFVLGDPLRNTILFEESFLNFFIVEERKKKNFDKEYY